MEKSYDDCGNAASFNPRVRLTMIMHEFHRSNQNEYLYHQIDECLNFQKHTHYSFEAVFVLDGILSCEVAEHTYLLSAGQGLLIQPGLIHSYTTEQYSRSYLCVFSNDLVQTFYDKTRNCLFSDPVFSFAENDAWDAIKILQDDNRSLYTKMAVLYRLCGQVFEQSTLLPMDPAYIILTNSLSMYIQSHYTQNISLREIAREFGYDYHYMSYFFNRNFGTDFPSYVNRYRLLYACELLTSTKENITTVALQSGFTTIRNFNRAFRKEMGESPASYRKKNQKADG